MTNKSQRKKELRKQIKALREQGYTAYISLSIATIEQMEAYLEEAKDWTPPEPYEEEEEILETPPADFSRINQATKLSELGSAIAGLAGTGDWADWEMKLWTKNGECRIYMKDCSYANPKERGYMQIRPDGSATHYCSRGKFPTLPPLPQVENDLQPAAAQTPEQRAIANLNHQFGAGNWSQTDFDDEIERFEYQ